MESVETEPKQLRAELLQIALVSDWTWLTYHLCYTVRCPYFLALQSENYWPATMQVSLDITKMNSPCCKVGFFHKFQMLH